MKRILVTGATGYIGSHLIKALSNSGYIVDGLDFNNSQNNIQPYVDNFYHIDITGEFYIGRQYDTVVHLAAKTMVAKSVENPMEYYKTNLLGTENILKKCKFKNFLYGSTGSAFQPGSSPYATSKRAAEDLVYLLDNYTVARFYNVSGNQGFKKYDNSFYHLIRKAAAVANGRFSCLDIYGDDYNTPDGTTIRNYTHISDIVNGLVNIIEYGSTNKVECLGSSIGYSVKEVIAAMNKACGYEINTTIKPRRPGEVEISILPEQSRFFRESKSILDQCKSALETEF